VRDAEYAVRGKIPLRGEEISKILKSADHPDRSLYTFKQTTSLNIGNP